MPAVSQMTSMVTIVKSGPPVSDLEYNCASSSRAQFDKVLTAYRRSSKLWSATLNRFADGRPV